MEVDGERAARNWTAAASSSVAVARTGESKEDDAMGDGSIEIRSAAAPDLPGKRGGAARRIKKPCEIRIALTAAATFPFLIPMPIIPLHWFLGHLGEVTDPFIFAEEVGLVGTNTSTSTRQVA